jgi:hypothetical protein
VKRLLSAVLVFAVLLLSASCGEIFVRGALHSGTETTAGIVSIVQFTATEGGTSITVVTLMQSGGQDAHFLRRPAYAIPGRPGRTRHICSWFLVRLRDRHRD